MWRFPYLANKDGGGAFLVPYFVAHLTVSIPLYTLEASIWQYFGLNYNVISRVG